MIAGAYQTESPAPWARWLRARWLVTGSLLLAAGCPSPHHNNSEPDNAILTVFAAASMRECIQSIGEDFQRNNPRHRLRYNFAGSQTLQAQIEHGARPNVFLAAACRHTQALHQKQLSQASRVFATNQLVLVVPADNPAKIERFEDLAKAKRLVLPARSVPAGQYTERLLQRWAGVAKPQALKKVRQAIVSREAHVRLVLQKVALGEADAGIVYKTDAIAAKGRVVAIAVPKTYAVVAQYCFAEINTAAKSKTKNFAAFLASPSAKRHLKRFGFGEPNRRTASAAPSSQP